ncbi:MAG: hypothetical protein D6820_11560, partial [Lentisphaerae bacterium]
KKNFFPNRKCAIWPSKGDPYIYLPEKWKSYIKTDAAGKRVEYEDVVYRKIELPFIKVSREMFPLWSCPIKNYFNAGDVSV